MKIIYLSWFNSGEGSQVHANEFMKAMNKLGHEMIPIELSFQSKKALTKKSYYGNIQKAAANRVTAFFREIKAVSMNVLRIIRLLGICFRYKPDAIINRYVLYDFSAIVVGRLLNIPVLYEVNASAVYEKELQNDFYFKALGQKIENMIFEKSDAVSVVSQSLKNYFADKKVNVSNTIVAPNGVNLDHYPAHPSVPDELSAISSAWTDKTVLGFLGSLKSWHGVQRAVSIMPELIAQNPDFRLLIIGDGNERATLEELIQTLNIEEYVYITGFIEHEKVPGALSIIDIALAPYEDLDHFYFSPLKIFEYMAAAKPVVAPPLGQITELIENHHSGILLKENNDRQLIENIIELSRDRTKSDLLGKQAKETVVSHYTWTANAQKISNSLTRKLHHIDGSKTMQKKISFFLPDLNPGGTERVMVNVVDGLAMDQEYRIQLVLMEKKGSLLDTLDPSIEIFDLNTKSALRSIGALKDYIITEKPDVLLSSKHYLNIAAMMAQKRSHIRTRMILAVHGNFFAESYSGIKNKIVSRLIPFLMRMFYPRADKVIAVSNGVRENIVRISGVSPDKVEVIHNPVILDSFAEKLEEPLDFPALARPYIVSVGRLAAEKNFPLLLRAYSQSEIRKHLDLVIVGDGDKRDELEKLIDELELQDCVHLAGQQVNPLKFMANAECFVLSSNSEGLPTVLIEALYAQTYIISTDCPSGPDEILRSGEYGILVPVGDELSLTKALDNIPQLPQLFDREQLRQRSLDFKLSLSIERYRDLINRYLNG